MDNSATSNSFISDKLSHSNLIYLHDGENKGIAKRLNHAANMAAARGFLWLLTMDQDSYFKEGVLNQYKEVINTYSYKDQTAIFGVNYTKENKTTNQLKEVPLLITSGSILNLKAMKSIGFFDENLFIDEVDSEYCYRARIRHYKIIECSQIFLHHHLGEIQLGRSLKSGRLTLRRLHAPVRLYYMVRNYFYVLKKLPQISEADKKEMKRGLLIRIKNNIIYNQKRFQVIKYILKGYLDFKKNKMGKISS